MLDRIVRGRAWIPLLGVMLAGIVAMQVEVLKLGATMGRAIQQGTALESRNALLRASVATLGDDQRIERLAAGMGMVMPAPTEVGFLSLRPGNAARAVRNIQPPNTSAFAASLAALAATASGPPTTVVPATSTSTGSPTSTSTVQATSGASSANTPTQAAVTTTPTQGSTGSSTATAPAQTPTSVTAPTQPTSQTGQSGGTSGGASPSGGG